ncbi:hypothetical protein [Spiroplasma taiwanense]|uniref:Uncharacterized protein n=1 Tax=Spiroplasma taiwanense CT-1 TaxID=1276220 RepID=S5MBS1_9MOLU|nr:hypothetical protein [Spiroplasma taiwanense]AGR41203.1 hypothetical protein STAIW_v1c05810 [Spiroplasma taiwanense CT-1]
MVFWEYIVAHGTLNDPLSVGIRWPTHESNTHQPHTINLSIESIQQHKDYNYITGLAYLWADFVSQKEKWNEEMKEEGEYYNLGYGVIEPYRSTASEVVFNFINIAFWYHHPFFNYPPLYNTYPSTTRPDDATIERVKQNWPNIRLKAEELFKKEVEYLQGPYYIETHKPLTDENWEKHLLYAKEVEFIKQQAEAAEKEKWEKMKRQQEDREISQPHNAKKEFESLPIDEQKIILTASQYNEIKRVFKSQKEKILNDEKLINGIFGSIDRELE